MISLPGYIDQEAWAGFEESRRRIRAPLTDRARKLVLYELQRIKDAGHDPNAALDQSTMLGWRDVFPPRSKEIQRASGSSTGELAAQEARQREHREAMADPVRRAAIEQARDMALRAVQRVK